MNTTIEFKATPQIPFIFKDISVLNSSKFIFPSPSKSASSIMDLTSASVTGSPRLFIVNLKSLCWFARINYWLNYVSIWKPIKNNKEWGYCLNFLPHHLWTFCLETAKIKLPLWNYISKGRNYVIICLSRPNAPNDTFSLATFNWADIWLSS